VSEFNVSTAAVSAAGARLGTLSAGMDEAVARVGGCSGAAAGTPLHGAFEELLGKWMGVLPRFGEASDRMSGAVSGAAGAYTTTDTGIAGAAAGEESGGE
jgi:hypothetical protein